jgi:6-phosphogluconolactonase
LKPQVRIYRDLPSASRAAAQDIASRAMGTIRGGGLFRLVLCGGATPLTLYQILAEEYRESVNWSKVLFFWSDERYVPATDPRSNYGMACRALLKPLAVPSDHVYPMPTNSPEPEAAALEYEEILESASDNMTPRFDLVILGIGRDGHTASLFPGSQALNEKGRKVVAVSAPADPPARLTMTLPVLNDASCVYFLASGANKREAIRDTLSGRCDAMACPASGVRPSGELIWWIDQQAAAS